MYVASEDDHEGHIKSVEEALIVHYYVLAWDKWKQSQCLSQLSTQYQESGECRYSSGDREEQEEEFKI